MRILTEAARTTTGEKETRKATLGTPTRSLMAPSDAGALTVRIAAQEKIVAHTA
jgi:hypothetical protein